MSASSPQGKQGNRKHGYIYHGRFSRSIIDELRELVEDMSEEEIALLLIEVNKLKSQDNQTRNTPKLTLVR